MYLRQGTDAKFRAAAYVFQMADLFANQDIATVPKAPPGEAAPLADRLRPGSLADIVGQEHLTGLTGRSAAWSLPDGLLR